MSTWQPHPDIPQDGLTYSWDENCTPASQRVFAKVEVTGLTFIQIAAVRGYATAMCDEVPK